MLKNIQFNKGYNKIDYYGEKDDMILKNGEKVLFLWLMNGRSDRIALCLGRKALPSSPDYKL